jgi:hypothetical protein
MAQNQDNVSEWSMAQNQDNVSEWSMVQNQDNVSEWSMVQNQDNVSRVEQKMSASETVNIVQSGLRKQFYMSNLFLKKIRWFIYQGFLDILWLSAIIKLTKQLN